MKCLSGRNEISLIILNRDGIFEKIYFYVPFMFFLGVYYNILV